MRNACIMLRSMWTKSAALAMAPEIKRKLERIVRSGQTEQRIALRARIVLGAAGGKSNNALAKELETSRSTVIDWRQRFAEGGVAALNADRPRGRSFKPLVWCLTQSFTIDPAAPAGAFSEPLCRD